MLHHASLPRGWCTPWRRIRAFEGKPYLDSAVQLCILRIVQRRGASAAQCYQNRSNIVSSPGEFHPQALSEPYVRLSPHTAPSVRVPRPLGTLAIIQSSSSEELAVSEVRLDHQRTFGPVPLQNLHPYYERFCPCAPLRYSGTRGFGRLRFSLRIGTTGSPVPHRSLIRVLAAYMPGASGALSRPIDGRPHLVPGNALSPGFDTALVISTRHRRFTFVQLLGSHLTQSLPRLFQRRSPPGLFTPAARGGLRAAPARRPRGALPHLRQSIQRGKILLSLHASVQDTQ
jgi:hypothetical protein